MLRFISIVLSLLVSFVAVPLYAEELAPTTTDNTSTVTVTTTDTKSAATESNVANNKKDTLTSNNLAKLSAKEKKIIADVKAMIQNLSPEIKAELLSFKRKMHELEAQKSAAYDALSQPVKDALSKQTKVKRPLSYKAKKALTQEELAIDANNNPDTTK